MDGGLAPLTLNILCEEETHDQESLLYNRPLVPGDLFELPLEVNAQTACLCAEFNEWDTISYPMKRRKDGSFTLAVSLKPGRRYRLWRNSAASRS